MQNNPRTAIKTINTLALALWIAGILWHCGSAPAQDTSNTKTPNNDSQATRDTTSEPFSPIIAQKFYEVAYELAGEAQECIDDATAPGTTDTQKLSRAIILMKATEQIDNKADYILPKIINSICHSQHQEQADQLYTLVVRYAQGKPSDLVVTRKAIAHLLEPLESREQREEILLRLLKDTGDTNPTLHSELATLLGLLAAEKADSQAASAYFLQAYKDNKYNKLAFAKLSELIGDQLKPQMQLEYLRLALTNNPLDLQAAISFAQYTSHLGLHQVAADAYCYCSSLFKYLHPSASLPPAIYTPWLLANYNTTGNQIKCLQIIEQIRQTGICDLQAEGIAGKAAAKIDQSQLALRIFQNAEEKAVRAFHLQSGTEKAKTAAELAWLYCFAQDDPAKAIDWANKAYSIDPNSSTASATLAYLLAADKQTDLAKSIIEQYQESPISKLALALIQIQEGKKDEALNTLKSIIDSQPASLEAEHANSILTQQGAQYIAPVDTSLIATALAETFGSQIVPEFAAPPQIISVALKMRGSKFDYGTELGATLAITNKSNEPLIVSDDGLLKGNIKIDAAITGDINKKIPNLVCIKVQPSLPVAPNHSILVPLCLSTRDLRNTLLTRPQASLEIEFTIFVDPVTGNNGEISNGLCEIKPAKALIKRPGLQITPEFLQNRINALSKGQIGQKVKTAQLCAGLLAEQHAMSQHQLPYNPTFADWMPTLLKAAIAHNLDQDDWVLKAHTMATLLAVPLDYELIQHIAKNLNDKHWPVRLICIYLLAENQGESFRKVLDWTATHDSHPLVRDMAIALGATATKS